MFLVFPASTKCVRVLIRTESPSPLPLNVVERLFQDAGGDARQGLDAFSYESQPFVRVLNTFHMLYRVRSLRVEG